MSHCTHCRSLLRPYCESYCSCEHHLEVMTGLLFQVASCWRLPGCRLHGRCFAICARCSGALPRSAWRDPPAPLPPALRSWRWPPSMTSRSPQTWPSLPLRYVSWLALCFRQTSFGRVELRIFALACNVPDVLPSKMSMGSDGASKVFLVLMDQRVHGVSLAWHLE